MRDKRQKNQLALAAPAEAQGEALRTTEQGTESHITEHPSESPTAHQHLMEEVCERENLRRALKRVKANKGSRASTG